MIDTAYGPNEVYTWDITDCPSQVNGLLYYLYMVMDGLLVLNKRSRKIVGYEVHERESGVIQSYCNASISKSAFRASPRLLLY